MKQGNSRATRTQLDQNSTRVSSTRAGARLEMLTSRVELGSSKLDSSSSSTRNVNDSTRAQLNSNLTRIISTATPTRHPMSSEGAIFFYKLITFKLVHSYNVKHLTCTILCSSELQNI